MSMRLFSGPALNRGGFSLIEALVAIAIFSIGILGAYNLQIKSTQSNALAERVSTSSSWASYAIEELLGKEYDDPDLEDKNNGSGSYGVAGLDDLEANADGVIYVQGNGSKAAAPTGSDLYSVSWNVVEGTAGETSVLRDVKQIRVHLVRNGGIGNGNLYSHDYYKTSEF